MVLRAEEESDDMYASIDKVIDVLEGQIRRNKTRLKKKFTMDQLRPDQLTDCLRLGQLKLNISNR